MSDLNVPPPLPPRNLPQTFFTPPKQVQPIPPTQVQTTPPRKPQLLPKPTQPSSQSPQTLPHQSPPPSPPPSLSPPLPTPRIQKLPLSESDLELLYLKLQDEIQQVSLESIDNPDCLMTPSTSAQPSDKTNIHNAPSTSAQTRTPPVPKPRTSLPPSKTQADQVQHIQPPQKQHTVQPVQQEPTVQSAKPVMPTKPFKIEEHIDAYDADDDDGIYEPVYPRNTRLSTLESMDLPTTSPQKIVEMWDTESLASVSSDPCSWLGDEPLYQFTRNYDAVPEKQSYTSIEVEEEVYYDISPPGGFYTTQHKTPWCGAYKVLEAKIIGKMSKQEIAVQEAKFEILTTESSFLKSLTVLKKHFMTSREFTNESILVREEHNQLFSLFKPIQKSSKLFLKDLDKCWKRGIFLPGIFLVIANHAKTNFSHFVTYCAHLNDIKDKLKQLKSVNKKFAKSLINLEDSDRCSRLTLDSFLATPMKRIVNLNLLLKTTRAVMLLNYDSNKTPEFEVELGQCLLALDYVQQVCKRCDLESQTTTRMKRMFELHSKLKFPLEMLQLSIISPDRWLVMQGDVKLHGKSERERTSNLLLLRKAKSKIFQTNTVIRLFLLNDMLIITKPLSDGNYKVKDYCNLANLLVSTPDVFMSSNQELLLDGKNEYKILLIIHENHESKRVELVLSCAVENEREVWVTSLSRQPSPDEARSATKRMVCVYPFEALEEGQVTLMKGDEVKVNKTLDNGWFQGVRTRGKMAGCFPPSRVEEASAVFPLVEIFN